MEAKSCKERQELLRRIENVIMDILIALNQNKPPILKIRRIFWKDIEFSDRISLNNNGHIINIHFIRPTSRSKFAKIIFILSKVYQLILRGEYITERELYYQNKVVLESQRTISETITVIGRLLNVPRWRLGIMSTAKGLLGGPCMICLKDGSVLDGNQAGGISIPFQIQDIYKFETTAKMILIIEKDACFQKLLLEGIKDIILITGKGFPDIATRRLVRHLWISLRLPIACLVDADPHGIAIMLVYRFGSLNLAVDSEELAVPAVKWLGLYPSEVVRLGIACKPLTDRDRQLLASLLTRSYLKEHSRIKFELETLQDMDLKVELEALAGTRSSFFKQCLCLQSIKYT